MNAPDLYVMIFALTPLLYFPLLNFLRFMCLDIIPGEAPFTSIAFSPPCDDDDDHRRPSQLLCSEGIITTESHLPYFPTSCNLSCFRGSKLMLSCLFFKQADALLPFLLSSFLKSDWEVAMLVICFNSLGWSYPVCHWLQHASRSPVTFCSQFPIF